MHLFASPRSERHAQARRITAEPIAAKYALIEPVSLLGKPSPEAGPEHSSRSEAPRTSCRSNVDNRKSALIFRERHPLPLCFA